MPVLDDELATELLELDTGVELLELDSGTLELVIELLELGVELLELGTLDVLSQEPKSSQACCQAQPTPGS